MRDSRAPKTVGRIRLIAELGAPDRAAAGRRAAPAASMSSSRRDAPERADRGVVGGGLLERGPPAGCRGGRRSPSRPLTACSAAVAHPGGAAPVGRHRELRQKNSRRKRSGRIALRDEARLRRSAAARRTGWCRRRARAVEPGHGRAHQRAVHGGAPGHSERLDCGYRNPGGWARCRASRGRRSDSAARRPARSGRTPGGLDDPPRRDRLARFVAQPGKGGLRANMTRKPRACAERTSAS